VVGLVGGLLRELPVVDFAADVDVGLVRVEVRGATGLVNGRFGGTDDLTRGEGVVSSSPVVRERV